MQSQTKGVSTVEGETRQAADDETSEVDQSASGSGSVCAMEMTSNNNRDSKVEGVIYDRMINNQNGVNATEILVPLSHTGKRINPFEGDNLHRLRDRKLLLEEKKRLCAWALGTALLGILLMIIHAELCPSVYQTGSNYAFIINCSISMSTGCLLILIAAFHYKDIREVLFGYSPVFMPTFIMVMSVASTSVRQIPVSVCLRAVLSLPSTHLYGYLKLFMIDHNQVDWRIAMTSNRIFGISLELLICAIHPVVTYWEMDVPVPKASGEAEVNASSSAPLCVSSRHGEALMDTELLFSALMFLRLYLVHRAILLHSKVLLSASYRSIGSLNNISFTFRFVLKVLMNKYPGRTLLVFILFFWLIASWIVTLCERQTQEVTGRMDTALWLIAITFLTVGYGDVSPKTSCGKAVCLFTGVMGVACTAMLVAVMTKKLALNKGEKHVHFFMMDIHISKRLRHAAANVLRECWLLHRTNLAKANSGEHRQHQRGLLEAIRIFRQLRLKQRKLRDYASEMVDLPKMQMIMCDLSANWNNSYRELEQRILSMERKLDELGRCFQQTSEQLAQALLYRNPENR